MCFVLNDLIAKVFLVITHEGTIFKCIFCEKELQENSILKEHMSLLRMLDVFNGICL